MQATERARLTLPASPLSEDERILHALNRLGYGPRPADLARVKAMGLAAYVEEQLNPDRLPSPAIERGPGELPGARGHARHSSSATIRSRRPQMRQRAWRAVRSTRRELREMFPPDRRPAVITAQMQAALVTRAVRERRAARGTRWRQFWFNHFNVFSQKGAVRWMVPAYEREAIRPHVLGSVPGSRAGHGAASGDALLSRQLDEHARRTS